MDLSQYDGKGVKVTLDNGDVFMGVCEKSGADFNFCEYGEDEDSLDIGGWKLYEGQIVSVELL